MTDEIKPDTKANESPVEEQAGTKLPAYTRGPTVGTVEGHLNVSLHELNKASIHSLEPNRDNAIKLGPVLVPKVPADAEGQATPASAATPAATAPVAPAPAGAVAWGAK